MEIKNYLELSEIELGRFVEFENRNRAEKLSVEKLDEMFKTVEYDFGKGVLIKLDQNRILGRILVILKECDKKGIAYFVRLEMCEEVTDKKLLVTELLEKSKALALAYGAHGLIFGTSNKDIMGILNSMGFYSKYSMLLMSLEDRARRADLLDLVELNKTNKKDYLRLYNDAFLEVPNGATLTAEELDEYLQESQACNDRYIAVKDGEGIGMLELEIEDGVGKFDLGLAASARGKGYGKMLLETAINKLMEKKVQEIQLTVASSNTLARDMYIRRGFQEVRVLGDWFEL